MKSVGTLNNGQVAVSEGVQGLDVMLVYEDFTTGLRARQAFEDVAHRLNLQADFHVNLWRFDILRDPPMLERAADEAARAQLVFLAAHGQSELPLAVKSWFNLWMARARGEPCALTVSLDTRARQSASANRMLASLRAAAAPKDVAVFHHFGESPPSDTGLAREDSRRRAVTMTAASDAIPRWPESYPHWGLNE
jgi:hypothetical protein